MSVKIMAEVWLLDLPHTEKIVLLALADNANDEGHCYPSIATLIKKCGLSERSVQSMITRLEEAGHVACQGRTGRSTIYAVHPRIDCTPAGRAPRTDCTPPRTDCGGTPAGRAPTPAGRAPITITQPSVEPSLNHQHTRTPKTQKVDEPPPSNLNVEAWHRWVQYREAIRKPIKPVSIPAAQRKLAGFGADQAAVVEQSIAEGYQGLFVLKGERNNSSEPRKTRYEQLLG